MIVTTFPGERRYHASRAAGIREVLHRENGGRREIEIALIENMQRKDLTPFEEADGLDRLMNQFEYTHEDMAKKIGKARSSVSETLTLRNITETVRKRSLESGVLSKSVLLQIAKQPTERKMLEMLAKILQGGLTRDEARRERREESTAPAKPQPFIFQYEPENEAFRFRIRLKKVTYPAMN